MKEVFVVDKITTVESTHGPGLKVELIPVKDVYSKNVKLVFYGDNCMQVLENFEIPNCVGDSISLEMKPKQAQSQLDEGDDDGVRDKAATRKTRK